jgi:hypothetical protein
METKIEIIHAHVTSDRSLNQKVAEAVHKAGSEWEVDSATTSVATCLDFRQAIYVQWVTTIVFRKKSKKRSNRP